MNYTITEEERTKLKQTIALLNSMVRGGENHSKQSENIVQEALGIVNNLLKPCVSGSIFVAAGRAERYRQIQSNSKFFVAGDDYIIKETETLLTIRKATIDYEGKTLKATKGESGWVRFQFVSQLPLGEFEFDTDESSEDCVAIYYR